MKDHSFEVGVGVSVDLPTLISSRLLIQANSGGGKSWLIRRVLEQTHGKVQQVVLDLEGEFSTLREKHDYILAGKGGDVAAEPRSAAMLARKVLELGVSAIVDLYELNHLDRKRFVRLFLEALVNAPKDLWHPVLVVIDEAHVFCPEQGQAESSEAVIDLATRGRKRGYCVVLATQRISKLHKDAAAECNNKLIGRTGLDIDMRRAADELGFSKAPVVSKDGGNNIHTLRTLDAGEFFAFGPAISREVVRVQVGEVSTTHPKAGHRFQGTTASPTAKIREVLAKLGDIPKEAEQEAKTVSDLQAEIRTLKRHQCPKGGVDESEMKRREVAFQTVENGYKSTIKQWESYVGRLYVAMEDVGKALQRFRELTPPDRKPPATYVPLSSPAPVKNEVTITRLSHDKEPDATLSHGMKLVLNAAAQCGDEGITKEHLTVLLGFKRSTRDAYIQRLRSAGFVSDQSGRVVATDTGIAALGSDFKPLPTGPELQEKVLREIPEGEAKILRVLIAYYPESVDREALTEMTGFKRSTRDAYLQRLESRQLVTSPSRGVVKASDKLF